MMGSLRDDFNEPGIEAFPRLRSRDVGLAMHIRAGADVERAGCVRKAL